MHLRAASLVRRHWNAIDAVARRLIRDGTLKEHEVLRLQKHENFLDALTDVISLDKDLELLFHKAVAALSHGTVTRPSATQDDHAAVGVVRQPAPKESGDFMDALRRAETPNGHQPTAAAKGAIWPGVRCDGLGSGGTDQFTSGSSASARSG
jgi:hypothetical protein